MPQPRLAIDELASDLALGAMSPGLLAIPHLRAFFGGRRIVRGAAGAAGLLGWGARKSGEAAAAGAARRGLPFARLEDGFIRSVGLGKAGAPAVSLVADESGVYYEAGRPSRLEAIYAGGDDFGRHEAEAGLARWRAARLSKYNIGASTPPAAAEGRVILVDQVRGDASIAGAGADMASFARMVRKALADFPRERLAARVHPDVAAGRARGALAELARRAGIAVLADEACPHAILDVAAEVWTVSSALGFEAILRGVPVTTFAMPFYAGWGATRDLAEGPVAEAARARRGARRDAAELFGGAFLAYARYADPVTRRPLDFDGAVDRLLDWRDRAKANAGTTTICFGFSRWKRRASESFLGGEDARLIFRGRAAAKALASVAPAPGARVAVWGMTDAPDFAGACAAKGLPLLRVEDGFLRSVGLGSDLLAPGSLVVDDRGLYYDARRESRIEALIEAGDMAPETLARARRLRERIVAEAVTKYNLGAPPVDPRAAANGRPVILVIEQVPGDAALRFGGADFSGNLALLEAARASRPDAFLVYKEHPDLVAGNRRGRLPAAELSRLADLVLSKGDVAGLYARIDELHCVSSLAGFEALLRGARVTTWGRPFYAGWGLTEDRLDFPRRRRRASLDELVAATLVAYPLYCDPLTLVPCGVEDFLDSLADLRAHGGPPPAVAKWRRQIGRLGRWMAAPFRG